MGVESNFSIALVHCSALWLAKKLSRHFLNQSKVEPNPIVTRTTFFPCLALAAFAPDKDSLSLKSRRPQT